MSTTKQFRYNSGNNCIEENGKFLAYLNISNVYCIINRMNELADENTQHENELKPIQNICTKYNIKLEDLPETLEEYIAYDNAEYEEKLRNQ